VNARLEVRDLCIRAAGRPVVQAVGFDVCAGEVVGLLGRSGAGKSLIARALVGLPPPDVEVAGSVRLEGRDLLALAETAWRSVRGPGVGLVFQEPATALDPVMPVGAQVAEALAIHGRARGRAARAEAGGWLAELGLDPDIAPPSRRPHQLSGGQRQRVALAAALALRPAVLVADEPTTALDPLVAAEVIDVLVRHAREGGGALLFISHDLALLARTADRLLWLDGGGIREEGSVREVLAVAAPGLPDAAPPPRPPPAPRPATAPVLEADGLVFRHPAGRRGKQGGGVAGVGFSLARGERLAVVGETGAGKSTLLRLLLGLERPQAGEVRLAGERFNPAPKAAQRRLRALIQPVFQDPAGSFDPLWTAGRIVAEPLRLLDISPMQAKARVVAALEAVGLDPADATRPARAFSGGQRQRLALARALAVEPDVLVLDEATSALDPASRADVLDLLRRLGMERGLACVAVTHDLHLVRAFADRVMVLKEGRVVESGPAATVLAGPQHPYTRALSAAAPSLETVLAGRL
jgi:peptide/nickel transport system ATP-binding protein